jgi:hypothetical protein
VLCEHKNWTDLDTRTGERFLQHQRGKKVTNELVSELKEHLKREKRWNKKKNKNISQKKL